MSSTTIPTATLLAVLAPAALLSVFGAIALLGRRSPERLQGPLTGAVLALATLASAIALSTLLATPGLPRVHVPLGRWFAAGGVTFDAELLADALSLTAATTICLVSGVIAAFAHRYLHREAGYQRFYLLFAAFVLGLLLVALAGTVELLFTGWELLGISSALLVAFFQERPVPVRNALHVFVVYRVGDAAMLVAAVLLHHYVGSGALAPLFLAGNTAAVAPSSLPVGAATIVSLLLVVAAAAKSAQLPFSSWLPRAMEGPTPSSAVFYGALSIHAGAYLLLRAGPLLLASPVARGALAALGLGTALYATVVGRAQTDIKSALSYAALTQVGIIFVEIALGLHLLASAHMLGHIFMRLLQFLRTPSLLHDLHHDEDAVGGHFARTGAHLDWLFPAGLRQRLYRWALERGQLEMLLELCVLRPFRTLFGWLDAFDRRTANLLAGRRSASEPASEQEPQKRGPTR